MGMYGTMPGPLEGRRSWVTQGPEQGARKKRKLQTPEDRWWWGRGSGGLKTGSKDWGGSRGWGVAAGAEAGSGGWRSRHSHPPLLWAYLQLLIPLPPIPLSSVKPQEGRWRLPGSSKVLTISSKGLPPLDSRHPPKINHLSHFQLCPPHSYFRPALCSMPPSSDHWAQWVGVLKWVFSCENLWASQVALVVKKPTCQRRRLSET